MNGQKQWESGISFETTEQYTSKFKYYNQSIYMVFSSYRISNYSIAWTYTDHFIKGVEIDKNGNVVRSNLRTAMRNSCPYTSEESEDLNAMYYMQGYVMSLNFEANFMYLSVDL